MAATPDATGAVAKSRLSLTDALAVYLKRRVLIILFLGFSSGLPLALSGSTLLVWMTRRASISAPSACSRWSARPIRSNFSGRRSSMRSTCLCCRGASAGAAAGSCCRSSCSSPRSSFSASCDPSASPSWWPSARSWSPPLRRRRTSSSTPSAWKAWARASRRPAWPPMSPPTASACWPRRRARCSW